MARTKCSKCPVFLPLVTLSQLPVLMHALRPMVLSLMTAGSSSLWLWSVLVSNVKFQYVCWWYHASGPMITLMSEGASTSTMLTPNLDSSPCRSPWVHWRGNRVVRAFQDREIPKCS
jgi:hypothetical protein